MRFLLRGIPAIHYSPRLWVGEETMGRNASWPPTSTYWAFEQGFSFPTVSWPWGKLVMVIWEPVMPAGVSPSSHNCGELETSGKLSKNPCKYLHFKHFPSIGER